MVSHRRRGPPTREQPSPSRWAWSRLAGGGLSSTTALCRCGTKSLAGTCTPTIQVRARMAFRRHCQERRWRRLAKTGRPIRPLKSPGVWATFKLGTATRAERGGIASALAGTRLRRLCPAVIARAVVAPTTNQTNHWNVTESSLVSGAPNQNVQDSGMCSESLRLPPARFTSARVADSKCPLARRTLWRGVPMGSWASTPILLIDGTGTRTAGGWNHE